MKFYGDEIGERATLMQVEVYVAEKGLFCEPQDAFDYWEKRNWKTKQGHTVKSLETAINVYNGVAIQKEKNRGRRLRGKSKKKRK